MSSYRKLFLQIYLKRPESKRSSHTAIAYLCVLALMNVASLYLIGSHFVALPDVGGSYVFPIYVGLVAVHHGVLVGGGRLAEGVRELSSATPLPARAELGYFVATCALFGVGVFATLAF